MYTTYIHIHTYTQQQNFANKHIVLAVCAASFAAFAVLGAVLTRPAIDARDSRGLTALLSAVQIGDLEEVKRLLEANANPGAWRTERGFCR